MGSDKLSPDKICRTCMCEALNMKSLFIKKDERTMSDLLTFTTNISINSDDVLPKQICSECEVYLCNADMFKRRCMDVDKILSQLFHNESLKNLTHIKPEKNTFEDNLVEEEPFQCSICLNKFAEISLLEMHVLNNHKNMNIPVINDFLSESNERLLKLQTIDEKDEQIVKKEFTVDYTNENDYNDFSDNNDTNSDTPLIEFAADGLQNSDKLITCPCGYSCTETDYKEHIQNNCQINGKHVKLKALTKKRKINEKSYTCEKCDLQFKTANSYNIHKRKHSENQEKSKEKYQCSMCMRKFIKKSSLTNHMKIHENHEQVKYTCGTCKREFKHKAHLDNHMVSLHPNEKGYSCEFCFKNFSTEDSLAIHKDLHKVDKKHTCQYCNKSFYMLSTLTDHIRTHTGEKPYLCSTCGRGFSQKTNLAQHMRRHQGLKPFKCENCDQRFVSKGELVAHTRKHSGAHPFICDDCGNGFTTSSSLVKHRRTHTGERPYACDLCTMRFAASGTLKNHRRTHTGEKPFQCSYCEKAFVQRNDLVSHIRCHTGERPFICGQCGSAFRKASALRAHSHSHGHNNVNVRNELTTNTQFETGDRVQKIPPF